MLHREIDDQELNALETKVPLSITHEEVIEGLIKRLRRVEVEALQAKNDATFAQATLEKTRAHEAAMRQRNIDEAAEQAKRHGGPYVFNRWRNWGLETPPFTGAFDMQDVCVGIVEALTQNGVIAWNGDGVSIVAQMVEAGHRRAEKAEQELADVRMDRDGLLGFKAAHAAIRKVLGIADKGEMGNPGDVSTLDEVERLVSERDEYKAGVMAVHELCDAAGIPHELEKPDGAAVLVTELPAWKRAERALLHWQALAEESAAKLRTVKKASRPRGRKTKTARKTKSKR